MLAVLALALELAAMPNGLRPTADAWQYAGIGAVRGLTIGPIENLRHAGRGYGSPAFERALDEAVAMGATWVSLTPFGRVHDLTPDGIDLCFEAPVEENREALANAVAQAHERGLRVMIVPHLWVESGEWRALIDPGSDDGWQRWSESYRSFLLYWATLAASSNVDLLSIGVELRTWVTTTRVESLLPIIDEVRSVYPGLLTYSSNWDDAELSMVWGAVDVIGINAFYPLADHDGASAIEQMIGGRRVAADLERFASEQQKPILLTEVGYTTRKDTAIRPWEWPDGMVDVVIDEQAQADAYAALLAPLTERASIAGFFVWRYYADPDDVSQEAEWGYSPRGKRAEVVLRDIFQSQLAADRGPLPGWLGGRHRARRPWRYGWEGSPPLFVP